jgi:hypothetical protein
VVSIPLPCRDFAVPDSIRFYTPLGVDDARNACVAPGVFTPN